MTPLIDFHTHRLPNISPDHITQEHNQSDIESDIGTAITITSLDYSEYITLSEPLSSCSIGLHPWFLYQNLFQNLCQNPNFAHGIDAQNLSSLDQVIDQVMQQIWQIAQDSRMIAIGECGLDRHHRVKYTHIPIPTHISNSDDTPQVIDLALQIKAFSAQIELSETLQKPLIIHCVKAFNELINLKQKHRPRMPWLVHGFDKKDDLRRSLAHHGIKVSFGASICHPQSPSREVIAAVPLEQLFLETDAQTKFEIRDIYREAAAIKQVPLEQLQEQLWQNFRNLFA